MPISPLNYLCPLLGTLGCWGHRAQTDMKMPLLPSEQCWGDVRLAGGLMRQVGGLQMDENHAFSPKRHVCHFIQDRYVVLLKAPGLAGTLGGFAAPHPFGLLLVSEPRPVLALPPPGPVTRPGMDM